MPPVWSQTAMQGDPPPLSRPRPAQGRSPPTPTPLAIFPPVSSANLPHFLRLGHRCSFRNLHQARQASLWQYRSLSARQGAHHWQPYRRQGVSRASRRHSSPDGARQSLRLAHLRPCNSVCALYAIIDGQFALEQIGEHRDQMAVQRAFLTRSKHNDLRDQPRIAFWIGKGRA